MLKKRSRVSAKSMGVFLLIFFFAFSCLLLTGNEASAAAKKNIVVKIKGSSAVKKGVSVEVSAEGLETPLTKKTNKGGTAKFTKLAAGEYTITPTKTGYYFVPTSKTITLGKKTTTTVSFTAKKSPAVSSISIDNSEVVTNESLSEDVTVTVKDSKDNGILNKTITAESSAPLVASVSPSSNTSDSDGEASFTIEGIAEGNAVVTFTSESKTVTTSVTILPADASIKWQTSGHADYTAEAFNHWNEDGEVSSSCAKCHSSSGFLDYAENGEVTISPTVGEVINCLTCHDDAAMDLETVTFPSGMTVTNLGHEAICMTCHQGRESKVSVDAALEGIETDTISSTIGFKNIHYFAAGATLYGTQSKGGYEYDGKLYHGKFPHMDEADTCIECHDMHSLKVNINKCAECHTDVTNVEDLKDIRMASSSHDYDGDGNTTEGMYYEMDGLQEALLSAIQNYAAITGTTDIAYDANTYPYFIIDTNGNGIVDAGETSKYNAWTPNLMRAAYNYQVSQKDPGAFAHNSKYIIELLYDSMEALGADVSTYTRNDSGHFDQTGMPFRDWDPEDPLLINTSTVSKSCTRCHSTDGFKYYLDPDGANFTDSELKTQPISYGFSCETCHTSDGFKDGSYDRISVAQIVWPGTTTNTITTTNTASDDSFICMSCHRGRESKATIDNVIEKNTLYGDALSFKNIHYLSAGATVFGTDAKVGYEYDSKTYEAAFNHWGSDSQGVAAKCTYCHALSAEEHSFEPKLTSTCTGCHTEVTGDDIETIRKSRTTDYDGDSNTTEELKDEIATLSAALFTEMQTVATTAGFPIAYDGSAYPYFFNDTNGNGVVDTDEATSGNKYSHWTAALLKAAFNYQYSQKEPGAWAHNTNYIAQLLIDSIEDLGGNVSTFNRP